jgi:hypothetical protein
LEPTHIHPQDVHQTIARYMLADGEHMVIDLAGSHGPYLRDAKHGRDYLDFYAYFASQPVAHNHPQMLDPNFQARLAEAALHKPANSDVYTTFMAEFVATFARVARPADMPYLFFIDGGALAVENALKTAFDWKVRKSLFSGKGEKGTQVIHFREALRLTPANEAARKGIIEAMKSRYLVYRLFLQYAFWLSRLKGNIQWGFIIGLYILIRFIDSIAGSNPGAAPYLYPVIYFYAAFVVFTWLIIPISNLFLQLNKFGRFALNRSEKLYARLIGILLLSGIINIAGVLATQKAFFFNLAVLSITLCLPLAAMQHIERKSHQKGMLVFIGFMILIGLGMTLLSLYGRNSGPLFMIYIFSALGSQILANYYLSKR